MPIRLRSLLLAFALAAFVFGCTVAPGGGSGREPAPTARLKAKPLRHALKPRAPTLGEQAARIALGAVGVPYRWGGASPSMGFDCSGLVYWAYRRLGLELPHSSYALYDRGRRVSRSRLKPGDLLFFFGLGHVGVYLGHGRMVHAPHSGTRVRVVSLGHSYYGGQLVGARRVAAA